MGVRCHSCDGVLHVASKHICQQHYSSQAILLDYASKSAFVFIYLGRDDSCHVEESCHYSLSLSDRPVAVRHTRIDLHTTENPTG